MCGPRVQCAGCGARRQPCGGGHRQARPTGRRLAGQWAHERRILVEVYPANWRKLGLAAGAIRNAEMLRLGKPDLVVAFPGHSGTEDMVGKARKAGVPVLLVMPAANDDDEPDGPRAA